MKLSAPPNPASIGDQTARGLVWLTMNTVLQKCVSIGVQLVLAWWLAPDDFGLIGLAYTVAAFGVLLQLTGMRDVLVHRSTSLRRWSNPAFWISASSGTFAALAMLAIAPFAAAAYDSPRLTGLIVPVAMTTVVTALSMVPLARLQAELRFRDHANVLLIDTIGTGALTVAMAYLGMGAYCFVLPRLITSFVQGLLVWSIAPVRVRMNMQFRRWPFLLGDVFKLVAASAFFTAAIQIDRIALGLFWSDAVVGIYFFAYNLSTQTMQLLLGNVANVLLPALRHLGERGDVHQRSVFIKVSRLIALMASPLCMLQALLAEPIVRLVYQRGDFTPSQTTVVAASRP